MTDDGFVVRLSQAEYDALRQSLQDQFKGADIWEFPWQGTRTVLVERHSAAVNG